MRALLFVVVGMLVGCANPPTITNQGAAGTVAAAIAPAGGQIATGVKNAADNYDKAAAIGVIPADYPSLVCTHNFLKLAGLEVTPGAVASQSFVPVISDAISAASVLDIQQYQLRSGKPITISDACKAQMGDLVFRGLVDGVRLAPGIRVLR